MASLDYRLQPRRIAENTWVIEGAVADFSRANGCNIINTAFIATGEARAGDQYRPLAPVRRAAAPRHRRRDRPARAPGAEPEPAPRLRFFGNQAWADVPIQALAGSIEGQRAEGEAYADNLYRLCGDWMRATQATGA